MAATLDTVCSSNSQSARSSRVTPPASPAMLDSVRDSNRPEQQNIPATHNANKYYATLANTLASLRPLFVPIWHDKDAQQRVAMRARTIGKQQQKQQKDNSSIPKNPEDDDDDEPDEDEGTLPVMTNKTETAAHLPTMIQLRTGRKKLSKIRDIFRLLADGVEQVDTVDYDLIEYALHALGFSPTDEECEKFKADVMRRQMSATLGNAAPAATPLASMAQSAAANAASAALTGTAQSTTTNRIDLAIFYHELKQTFIKKDEPQYVELMRDLFKECDLREAGLITADDVRAMLMFMGDQNTMTEDEIVELVKDCDLDDDGGINQKEFFKIMKYSQLHPEWKLVYCKKDAGGGGGGGGSSTKRKKKTDENRLLNNPLKMLKTKYNY